MIESIDDFHFEEDGHAYIHNGRNNPSVTGLLKDYGLISYDMVNPTVLLRKREQGKTLHAWTAVYDTTGESDMLSIPEEAEGYASAYLNFRRESGFEVVEVEKPLMSKIYGVLIGGTPDRELVYRKIRKVTLDLKFCAQKMPAWGVQTGGYEMLKYRRTVLGRTERMSLMLFPDGKYHLQTYTDPADGDAFLAIAALEAWKQNHRIKK